MTNALETIREKYPHLRHGRRKVTQETVGAFLEREPKTTGNTTTDGDVLLLHGNKIAEWRDGFVWITDAGWPTMTTRERLGGIVTVWGDSDVPRSEDAPEKADYRPARSHYGWWSKETPVRGSGHRIRGASGEMEPWGGEWIKIHRPGQSDAWAEV